MELEPDLFRPGRDTPDVDVMEDLFPELSFACEHRWVMELVLKYCDSLEKGRD